MRSANFLSKFQRSISLNFLEALYETLQSISRQNLVGQLITDVDEYVGSRKVYPSTPDVSQVQESAFNLVELTELYNNDISRDNTSDEQKEKVLLRMKVVAEVMGDTYFSLEAFRYNLPTTLLGSDLMKVRKI